MLAIDLAKNVFQLHGVDERGHPLLCKAVKRAKLTEVVQNLPPCRIVMEACGGAHYWARRFQVMGHAVQLIAAQFVKPFVKSHKNDRHDAEAIAEAAARPTMRYVPVKSVEQQDIQTLHRIRSLLMKDRVAQINQIRGLLAEYGLVIPQNAERVRQQLPSILEDGANALTPLTQELMRDLYERLVGLDERIARYDQHIQQLHQHSPISRKLDEVRGVGPLIATAVLAGVGDAKDFKNGRQFAAWLGLVPRQHSSGGKPRLCWVSPSGVTNICERCWCMAPGRWSRKPRVGTMGSPAGSTSSGHGAARTSPWWPSPTKRLGCSGRCSPGTRITGSPVRAGSFVWSGGFG